MELASAISLDGHDYSNFRTAVGKLIFMAPWRPDMQFTIQQISTHKFSISQQRPSAHATDNRAEWFKKLCWNSLVALTQIGPAIQQHAKVLRDIVAMTQRDDVQPKSETDSDQSQFMRSRVLRSQCLHRRTVGTRRTLQGTSLQSFSSSRH